MEIEAQAMPSKPRREPWNKGKLIGQRPPSWSRLTNQEDDHGD